MRSLPLIVDNGGVGAPLGLVEDGVGEQHTLGADLEAAVGKVEDLDLLARQRCWRCDWVVDLDVRDFEGAGVEIFNPWTYSWYYSNAL
jgi:hypothetical protein